MTAVGQSLKARYEKLLQTNKIDFHDVDVTSSNYRRTVQSAQALLSGLLPHYQEFYDDDDDDVGSEFATFDELDADGDGWISSDELGSQPVEGLLPVKIPTVQNPYINVYPLIPEIAETLKSLKDSVHFSSGSFLTTTILLWCLVRPV